MVTLASCFSFRAWASEFKVLIVRRKLGLRSRISRSASAGPEPVRV